MRVMVSLPDALFEEGEQLAARLGISRSELYALALAAFLHERQAERVTERLNEIHGEQGSTLDEVMYRLQFLSLPPGEW